MVIKMTSKHQITIPKDITNILGLNKGSMFDVRLKNNRIELVPLELMEKTFTEDEYETLNTIVKKEKASGKELSNDFIENLEKGIIE